MAVTAALALVAGACGERGPGAPGGEPRVAAAFYPLVWAAESVGGDLVQVENLTAAGVEPHDFELSADQVGTLSEADLVVFLGGGFQPAVEDVVSGLGDTRLLDVLEVPYEGEGPTQDPHVWLDPSMMATIVDEISVRLGKLVGSDAETFERNAAALHARLMALDGEFKAALADCESRDIVTSHAAFGYLAARYDLNQVSISGIDPEAEPSPGRLAEVARFVRDHDVTTIFFEELVSPDVAETIAAETGARTDMLNPLESEPESGDYIDAMRENLAALTEALGCE